MCIRDRYYKMDERDLSLYEGERDKFYKKYKNEIKAYRTAKLIGAGELRDYDFRCLPGDILETLDKYPPFEGYHLSLIHIYIGLRSNKEYFPIKNKKICSCGTKLILGITDKL